jgi:hypothetical protein
MALSRYICIYITQERKIRDVTTIHAGDDSEACEQALAGCLARREVDLGYELWRPKRWVAAYYPKGGTYTGPVKVGEGVKHDPALKPSAAV